MESLQSISENPFFKHFGVKHNVPAPLRRRHHSHIPETDNCQSVTDPSSSSKYEEDDIVEYRPVSGFVNKLLDKFTSLSTREDQAVSQSRLKRFSSLDQLQVDNEAATTDSSKIPSETSSTLDKQPKLPANKAKSIENLSNAHHTPQHYNRHGVAVQNFEKNTNKQNESASSKFQRDHNLARQDIIIIEKTPDVPIKGSKNDEIVCKNAPFDVASNYEISNSEMPKPNTVLTVRTIFENASQTNLLLQRRKSDQPLSPNSPLFKAALLPLQIEQSSFSHDGASKRNSLHNLSPTRPPRYGGETFSKPVLLPVNASFKRQFNSSRPPSDSHSGLEDVRSTPSSPINPRTNSHSGPEDIRSTPSSPISPRTNSHSGPEDVRSTPSSPINPRTNYSENITSPRENVNLLSVSDANSQSVVDNKSPVFEGFQVVASTKSSSSTHPTSRSTASIKPTINNKQNAPVVPVPLTAPASSTTTFQKSRPVVSVAPYREKQEDGKYSYHSSNIFTDSKLSTREDKPQRTIHAEQLSNFSSENKDEESKHTNDVILPKDAKKIFEKDIATNVAIMPNNKTESHNKRRSVELNNKNTENNITNQNISAKTIIEIRNNHASIVNKEHPLLGETPNITEKESGLKPPAKLVSESSTKLTKPKRMAPAPPVNTKSKPDVAHSTAPKTQINEDPNKNLPLNIIPNEDSQKQTPKDITPPIKRSHSKDTQIINEPPAKISAEDGPESQDQPVKGIPSIIAKRLNQPNSNPSQVAKNLLIISDNSAPSHNTNNNPYSRTLLTPAGENKTSPDHTKKDALSIEIENEITAVRRKMEANRSKSGGPAQIFDSSQLAKKKKVKQTLSDGLVPLLDLSVITDEIMEYQPHLTKVQPCNIVFIGENAKTSRSLLDKKRKVKISIHFNDQKTETFEYPSEGVALEEYLEDHPNEREEILVLEDFSGTNGDSMESSDDVEIDIYLTSPTNDGLLTSNTSLSHSGNLQSYRGRYQQEYQFGAALVEQPQVPVTSEPALNAEKQMLRPAEEDDTNIWSTSDSSDLLF